MLDRNYRLFGLINPVDLVAVLLVLAVGFVAFYLLRGGSPVGGGGDLVEARVALLVRDVRDVEVDITAGDETIKSGVGTIGHVESVTVRPTIREVPMADGGLAATESELFTEAIIVVEGQGRVTDAGVLIGEVLLAVNEIIEVKTPRFSAKMTVMSLELAE